MQVNPLLPFTATFDEWLDPSTVTTATVQLAVTSNSNPVTGTVAYDDPSKTVTFTPSAALQANTGYTATLHTGIHDLASLPLASDYVFAFTTGAVAGPSVIAVLPSSKDHFIGPELHPVLTFDQALDVTTIVGNVNLVGVTTTASYDSVRHAVTLSPSAPLSLATTYTLEVLAGLKASGGAAAIPGMYSFTTHAVPSVLSGSTPALARQPRLVFDPSGNAMAVWTVETGLSSVLVASHYTASTQTWTAPVTLGSGPAGTLVADGNDQYATITTYGGGPVYVYSAGAWTATTGVTATNRALVATDSGFCYLANDWSTLSLVRYDGTSFGTPLTLSSNGPYGKVSLAGRGNECTALWADSATTVKTRTLTGGTLGSETLLATITGGPTLQHLALAANTGGYVAAWNAAQDAYLGPTSTYASIFSSNWSSPSTVATTGANESLYAATDGSGFMVFTFDYPVTMTAYRYSGSWSSGSTVGPLDGQVPLLAGGPQGYAVAWVSASNAVYLNVATAGSFGTPQPLASATSLTPDLTLAATGSGFVAAFTSGSDVDEVRWSSSGYGTPAEIDGSAITATGPALVTRGSDAVLAYAQAGAVATRTFTGSWSAVQVLPAGAYSGAPVAPVMATTASGHALVVWSQYAGGVQGLYAAEYGGTGWSAPFLVDAVGDIPAVATDGAGFLVAYRSGTTLLARGVSGTTVGAAATVATGLGVGSGASQIAVGSNGSLWLVSWRGTAYFSADGQAWGAGYSACSGDGIRIASDGSGFSVFCAVTSLLSYSARVYASGAWDSAAHTFPAADDLDFTGGPGGYLFAGGLGTSGHGITMSTNTGSGWSTQMLLVGIDSVNNVQVRPSGSGFAALMKGGQLHWAQSSGTSFPSPGLLTGTSYVDSSTRLSVSGDGDALITTGNGKLDGNFFRLGTNAVLIKTTLSPNSGVKYGVLGSGAADFAATWVETDSSGLTQVWGLGGL